MAGAALHKEINTMWSCVILPGCKNSLFTVIFKAKLRWAWWVYHVYLMLSLPLSLSLSRSSSFSYSVFVSPFLRKTRDPENDCHFWCFFLAFIHIYIIGMINSGIFNHSFTQSFLYWSIHKHLTTLMQNTN